MKRAIMLAGLLIYMGAAVGALGQMDASERRVRIIEGPRIFDVSDHSAKIEWVTNSEGANQVRYRIAGSNYDWQSAYHRGGGTRHFLLLDNLEPGRTYEWQILTRDGDVRTSGEFRTEGRRHHDHDGDRDHDGDDGRYGNRVALFRGVNSNGSHLYSTNEGEQNERHFRLEGPAGYIFSQPRGGAAPLYRMTSRTGDCLLVVDRNDVQRAIGWGYREDGVIGYIATAQLPGTVPFYRLVKPDGSAHFFTTSEQERAETLRRGWKDEGITGYVWMQ